MKEFSLTDPIDFAAWILCFWEEVLTGSRCWYAADCRKSKRTFGIMWKTEAVSWRYAEAISFWAIITTQMRADRRAFSGRPVH